MPEHRTRAQQRVDEIDISPAKLLDDIETLKQELEEARKGSDDYLTGLQRERAEFQNFKRRTAEERERDAGLASEDLLRKVLTVADDFDLAIEARPDEVAEHPWFEGISAIDRKLRALLESEGVNTIDSTPGRAFDPREHDAIVTVPDSDRAEGHIVEEIRRGYRLRDRVLRPALVAVAGSAPDGAPDPGSPEAGEARGPGYTNGHPSS